mgnify:CR=1 FL=1
MTEPSSLPTATTPYDASDPKQVEKAKLEASRRDKETRDVLTALLGTPAGRSWMWSTLSSANVFSQTFVLGDPHATSFNEGRRSMANQILTDIVRHCPDQYMVMQREASK